MATIDILYPETLGTISPDIYGHFSEHIGGVIYDGIWVGEDSEVPNIDGFRKELVELFRSIRPAVLRWPGGCFAETYNWRDGIGPRAERPVTVNWWYNSDKRLESNAVGTHEFMRFCRLVGAKPYFAANATSLTPLEIRNWIEYCNFPRDSTTLAKLREANGDAEPFAVGYWGLGNENWGGGGNMTPESYCDTYRKYAIIAGSVAPESKFIACGPNGGDVDWTRRFLAGFFAPQSGGAQYGTKLDGLSLHYYCGTAGEAVKFTEDQWYELLNKACRMEELILQHRGAMDSYDPKRSVGLVVDEWGCWHNGGSGPSAGGNLFEQQGTMRDALVAAMTLNIFNNHCDIVMMANVAQLVNNLHCLFLAGGARMTATPSYHVFDMMKGHQGAKAVKAVASTRRVGGVDEVSCSCSVKDGKTLLTLVNANYSDAIDVELILHGAAFGGPAANAVLTASPQAHNTFDDPNAVRPEHSTVSASGDKMTLQLPAASVTCLQF